MATVLDDYLYGPKEEPPLSDGDIQSLIDQYLGPETLVPPSPTASTTAPVYSSPANTFTPTPSWIGQGYLAAQDAYNYQQPSQPLPTPASYVPTDQPSPGTEAPGQEPNPFTTPIQNTADGYRSIYADVGASAPADPWVTGIGTTPYTYQAPSEETRKVAEPTPPLVDNNNAWWDDGKGGGFWISPEGRLWDNATRSWKDSSSTTDAQAFNEQARKYADTYQAWQSRADQMQNMRQGHKFEPIADATRGDYLAFRQQQDDREQADFQKEMEKALPYYYRQNTVSGSPLDRAGYEGQTPIRRIDQPGAAEEAQRVVDWQRDSLQYEIPQPQMSRRTVMLEDGNSVTYETDPKTGKERIVKGAVAQPVIDKAIGLQNWYFKNIQNPIGELLFNNPSVGMGGGESLGVGAASINASQDYLNAQEEHRKEEHKKMTDRWNAADGDISKFWSMSSAAYRERPTREQVFGGIFFDPMNYAGMGAGESILGGIKAGESVFGDVIRAVAAVDSAFNKVQMFAGKPILGAIAGIATNKYVFDNESGKSYLEAALIGIAAAYATPMAIKKVLAETTVRGLADPRVHREFEKMLREEGTPSIIELYAKAQKDAADTNGTGELTRKYMRLQYRVEQQQGKWANRAIDMPELTLPGEAAVKAPAQNITEAVKAARIAAPTPEAAQVADDVLAHTNRMGGTVHDDGTVTVFAEVTPEQAAVINETGTIEDAADMRFGATAPKRLTKQGNQLISIRVPAHELALSEDVAGNTIIKAAGGKVAGAVEDVAQPIARGRESIVAAINAQVENGTMTREAADKAIRGINKLPENLLEDLAIDFTDGQVLDEAGNAVAGQLLPKDSVIRIAAGIGEGLEDPAVVILHEVSHHLETILNRRDYITLRVQWMRELEEQGIKLNSTKLADALDARAEIHAAIKSGARKVEDLTEEERWLYEWSPNRPNTPQLEIQVEEQDFSEWFAERMVNNILRDTMPAASRGIIESLTGRVKEFATKIYDWLMSRGERDTAERIYRTFISGKYKPSEDMQSILTRAMNMAKRQAVTKAKDTVVAEKSVYSPNATAQNAAGQDPLRITNGVANHETPLGAIFEDGRGNRFVVISHNQETPVFAHVEKDTLKPVTKDALRASVDPNDFIPGRVSTELYPTGLTRQDELLKLRLNGIIKNIEEGKGFNGEKLRKGVAKLTDADVEKEFARIELSSKGMNEFEVEKELNRRIAEGTLSTPFVEDAMTRLELTRQGMDAAQIESELAARAAARPKPAPKSYPAVAETPQVGPAAGSYLQRRMTPILTTTKRSVPAFTAGDKAVVGLKTVAKIAKKGAMPAVGAEIGYRRTKDENGYWQVVGILGGAAVGFGFGSLITSPMMTKALTRQAEKVINVDRNAAAKWGLFNESRSWLRKSTEWARLAKYKSDPETYDLVHNTLLGIGVGHAQAAADAAKIYARLKEAFPTMDKSGYIDGLVYLDQHGEPLLVDGKELLKVDVQQVAQMLPVYTGEMSPQELYILRVQARKGISEAERARLLADAVHYSNERFDYLTFGAISKDERIAALKEVGDIVGRYSALNPNKGTALGLAEGGIYMPRRLADVGPDTVKTGFFTSGGPTTSEKNRLYPTRIAGEQAGRVYSNIEENFYQYISEEVSAYWKRQAAAAVLLRKDAEGKLLAYPELRKDPELQQLKAEILDYTKQLKKEQRELDAIERRGVKNDTERKFLQSSLDQHEARIQDLEKAMADRTKPDAERLKTATKALAEERTRMRQYQAQLREAIKESGDANGELRAMLTRNTEHQKTNLRLQKQINKLVDAAYAEPKGFRGAIDAVLKSGENPFTRDDIKALFGGNKQIQPIWGSYNRNGALIRKLREELARTPVSVAEHKALAQRILRLEENRLAKLNDSLRKALIVRTDEMGALGKRVDTALKETRALQERVAKVTDGNLQKATSRGYSRNVDDIEKVTQQVLKRTQEGRALREEMTQSKLLSDTASKEVSDASQAATTAETNLQYQRDQGRIRAQKLAEKERDVEAARTEILRGNRTERDLKLKLAEAERARNPILNPDTGNGRLVRVHKKALGIEAELAKQQDTVDSLQEALDAVRKERKRMMYEKREALKTQKDLGYTAINMNELGGYLFPARTANEWNLNLAKGVKRSSEAEDIYNTINDAMRTMTAGGDFSAIGIQLATLSYSHPEIAFKAVTLAMDRMGDEFALGRYILAADRETARLAKQGVVEPNVAEMTSYGLHISGAGEISASAHGSSGLSNTIEKYYPTIGITGRAYTNMGNFARIDLFKVLFRETVDRLGQDAAMKPENLRAIAKAVNTATGYAEKGFFTGRGPSTVMFASRFFQSTLDMVFKSLNVTAWRYENTVARQQMLKMLGIGTMLTYFFNDMLGNETDTTLFKKKEGGVYVNPNFMTIRFQGHDVSLFGPWLSTFKLAVLLGGTAYYGTGTLGSLGGALRSKLGPVPAMLADLKSGENIMGESMTDPYYLASKVVPIFAVNAIREGKMAFVDKKQSPDEAAFGFFAQLFGLRANPMTDYEKSIMRFEKEKGIKWTEATGQQQKAWEEAGNRIEPSSKKAKIAEEARKRRLEQEAKYVKTYTSDGNGNQQKDANGNPVITDRAGFRKQIEDYEAKEAYRLRAEMEASGGNKPTKRPDDPNRAALWEYYKSWEDAKNEDGSIDFDKQKSLLDDYEKNWTPEQKDYVDQRRTQQHDPVVQKLYDDKKKLRDAGFWDNYEKAWQELKDSLDEEELNQYPSYTKWYANALRQKISDLRETGLYDENTIEGDAKRILAKDPIVKIFSNLTKRYKSDWIIEHRESGEAAIAAYWGYLTAGSDLNYIGQ